MAIVTVCVPVYNAEAFVAETLDSVVKQTLSDLRILISLDKSTDDSEGVCRRYLEDPRVELIVQPDRLGWVGNVNALITRVDTPYFCIVPHDDRLHPRYLSEVLALADSDPAIACAYSDIEGFGANRQRFEQPEIRGERLERVLDVLLNHYCAVAFRGVVRRFGPGDRPFVPTGLRGDVAADAAWMVQLALRGELRRVPATLYAKRYAADSVHAAWFRYSRLERIALWAEQAAACTRIALEHVVDPVDRNIVLAAALMRVAGVGDAANRSSTPRGATAVAAANEIFKRALGDIPLPDDTNGLLSHPHARLLRQAVAKMASRSSPRQLPGKIRRRLTWFLGR